MPAITLRLPVRSALKVAYALLALLFLATISFGIFYLCSGFSHLVSWYFSLNCCFYNSTTWAQKFFTPAIKSDGNMYSAIAIAVSLFGLYYLIRKCPFINTNVPASITVCIKPLDAVLSLVLVATAFALWLYGFRHAAVGYDEVFSAQNAAGIHPFQAVSYYMLPNNHVFFNLLNDVFFHWANDKVVTGRIISLLAYEGVILALFYWLRRITRNSWFAFFASAVLCFQWLTWGFAYQARGYELYLLAEWGMLISFLAYTQAQRRRWLYINLLCSIVGYFTIPSFLYFHLTQLLFAAVYFIARRKGGAAFWKSQLAIMLLTFLCYVPLLCFSGIDAIIKNGYVSPWKHHEANFWNWMTDYLIRYFNHLFSITKYYGSKKIYWFFLIPSPALFAWRRNKLVFFTACFYVLSWVVFFLLTLQMVHVPFERNLIGNYSLTIMACLLMIYWVFGLLPRNVLGKSLQFLAVAASLAICIHGTIHKYDVLLEDRLYEFPVNEVHADVQHKLLDSIPKGNTVGFYYEDFYCRYICFENGYVTTNPNCPTGTESYFVKRDFEPFPSAAKYQLVGHANEYEIYKRSADTTAH